MVIKLNFYSYFKDLAGCSSATETMPAGSTVGDLVKVILSRFPRLEPMQKSLLLAVGVDYQSRDYVLQEGDEVSFFPPVQGG